MNGADAPEKFELPPEAKAAHAKLQVALKKAKEEEAARNKFRRYDSQGWMKTEDADKKAEPGKTVLSSTFRSAGVPLERQARVQQIESNINARSVGQSDLWADVTDLIEGGGEENLLALGSAILKKQRLAREAEDRARAKKLEEERQMLASKQSDLTFDEVAKMLMPNYDRAKRKFFDGNGNETMNSPSSNSHNNNNNGNDDDFQTEMDQNSSWKAPKKLSKYAGDADFDLL